MQHSDPPSPPIPKSSGRVKEGASKYKGVSYNKQSNKWHATITVKGKQRHIGYYDDEEEAAVDYARAVFKYTADRTEGKATNRCSRALTLGVKFFEGSSE